MNKISPVYTLKNKCADCYKCVRECHIKAIKVEDGSASVLSEKCIACGNCVSACPSGAKKVRNDIEKARNLLMAKTALNQHVYISLAPTWAGVFDYEAKKMVAILKQLGFKGISETALGAQEVSIETAKMLNSAQKAAEKNGNGTIFISSACPTVVDYIKFYNPKYAKNITPIASPALTHAKMLKEIYGENIGVVFIGPCVAKKNESDRNPDLINVSLTFEELKYWISEEYIDIKSIKNDEEGFVPENSFEGSLYPIEGGMNETIKRVGINENVQLLGVSSIPTIERALDGLALDKLKKVIFVEALACDGGCVAGPCISSKKASLEIMSDIISNSKVRQKIPTKAKTVVKQDFTPQKVENQTFTMEEMKKGLKRIGKTNSEDELNCGGCGYSTCRELVSALLADDAEVSMCVSYMRQIAHRKADALLRCMPNAMVMVDKDLKIVEANNSFIKMFAPDLLELGADGLKGASIDRLVDFDLLFKTCLKKGKDVHKEHHPSKNKLYDITTFTIDKNELVGAIITDVTTGQMNREKISQRAQEVITKNISIVQNIACLLGEHMVETELLLSKIASDYETETAPETTPETRQ